MVQQLMFGNGYVFLARTLFGCGNLCIPILVNSCKQNGPYAVGI